MKHWGPVARHRRSPVEQGGVHRFGSATYAAS